MSDISTNEAVVMKNVCKDFKVLNRHEGLKGSIQDLFSRDYKTVSAVKDVTLTVNRGEIIGYLGPNGAGKSTTIKMMTGVLEEPYGELREHRSCFRTEKPAVVVAAPYRILQAPQRPLYGPGERL